QRFSSGKGGDSVVFTLRAPCLSIVPACRAIAVQHLRLRGAGGKPQALSTIDERRGGHPMHRGPEAPRGSALLAVRKGLRQILTSSSAVSFLPFVSGPRSTARMTNSRNPMVLYIIGSANPIF